MGFEVKEGKTKYMPSSSKEFQCLGSQMYAGSYTFEVVKDFIYLGTGVNSSNNISMGSVRRYVAELSLSTDKSNTL